MTMKMTMIISKEKLINFKNTNNNTIYKDKYW